MGETERGGIVVEEPGMLTTVQDLGRWGWQHDGVSVSGAMDPVSHCRANRLVDNPDTAATLEVTLTGPVLRFEQSCRIVVSGAIFELRLDDYPVSADTVLRADPGQTLVFGRRTAGARAYVAVAGGIDVPLVLGSRSTHLGSRMGGYDGRAIRAGDRLPVGPAYARVPGEPRAHVRTDADANLRAPAQGGARVRILPGPHLDLFQGADPIATLAASRYTLRSESDRMGYRLAGSPIVGCDVGGLPHGFLSHGLPPGSVQAPPDGGVIVAMADRQTAGGYPRIAMVITADLPRLGQLAPGDWIEFAPCDIDVACAALAAEQDRAGHA